MMGVVFPLAAASMRQHRGRIALTAAAMIAAAAMIVWVVSGYDALVNQFESMADDYLGRYDLMIVPADPADAALADELLVQLQGDPMVAEVVAVTQSAAAIRLPDATAGAGSEAPTAPPRGGRNRRRMPRPMLVGIDAVEPPYPLAEGRWFDERSAAAGQGVLSREVAAMYKVGVGDRVVVTRSSHPQGLPDADATPREIEVIGLIEQVGTQAALVPRGEPARGAARGLAASALFVPQALATEIRGHASPTNVIGIRLAAESTVAKFRSDWNEKFAAAQPPASSFTAQEAEAGLEDSFFASSIRSQAYAATGMSLLAATFIVFTALSMGVQERVREFAVMRALALTRGQIAGLVACEAGLLAALGWLGGLAAGWGILQIARSARPDLFENGAELGIQCLWLTAVSAIGGALLAAIVPLWRATRAAPLEAMTRPLPAASARISGWTLLAGLALIALGPLFIYVFPFPDSFRYSVAAPLGYTSMAIGFVLTAPALLLVTERLLGPLVARLFGIDHQLFATQLSANLWRTLGAAIALTIGLGLFVATQTWGYSMLRPFLPGPWMPDLVAILPRPVPADEIRNALSDDVERILPIYLEQPKLTGDITHSEVRSNATRADSVVVVGFDVDQALGGDQPMFDFEFVAGNRDDARSNLAAGGYCLIPDFLRDEAGLEVGDSLELTPPAAPDRRVTYSIVGIVTQPGVHWLTKGTALRPRSSLMAGMVFVSASDAQRDFGLTDSRYYWMDVKPGTTPRDVQQALAPLAISEGKPVTSADPFAFQWPGVDFGDPRSAVTIRTAEGVHAIVSGRADEVIWGMSRLPLVTLAIASLGILNLVMASVRARQWEFGVLRAVGITRWGLVRLVLAEAVLVGIVACLLSLAWGVASGYLATELARYVYRHGGHIVPLVVPWSQLAVGFALTLALCLLAALVPSVWLGRAEPLRLLQAGRAAN